MKGAYTSKSQRGLTLVELMIAMLLGVFLIGGLLQIFISSKQTYQNAGRLIQIAGEWPVCDRFYHSGYSHGWFSGLL